MTKTFTLAVFALLTVLSVACTATIQAPPEPKPVPARRVAVEIAAQPGDAEIYLDGKFVGTTTMEVRLTPGTYKLEIRRAGFKPWVRDLSVADYATRVTALLERE